MHTEPTIIDIGFRTNRRGGWWYREESNRYTIQIIPSGKEQRGWMLGIARPGGMKWGKQTYPSPEAAAFQAFRVTGDPDKADALSEAMRQRQEERMSDIQARIKQFKGKTAYKEGS